MFKELKELEAEEKELAANRIKRIALRTRPKYLKEMNPWNQFLNKNAPGCPISTTIGEDNWSQIIPAGGINILTDWIERENDHLDGMSQASLLQQSCCSEL